MVAVDGAGFDWSFMEEEEEPANLGLMAFSDSEVHILEKCSNSCRALKDYENVKKQYDDLRVEFNQVNSSLTNHKRGLAVLEEQIVFYRQNESNFSDEIGLLKRDLQLKDVTYAYLDLS